MKIVAGIIPTFTLPKTKPFVFENVYTASDEDSAQRLREASQLREAVVAATTQGDSALAADAIDQYLPVLHGVISSIAAHSGRPKTSAGGVNFSWTSGGDKEPGKKYYQLYTMGYEMCMMVSTRAYCNCNMAAQELESPSGMGDEPSKKALALLKNAASIFLAVSKHMLPLSESLPVQRAPEVLQLYHQALERICRVSCQLLAINQAIIRGMSVPLVAKLYSGASHLCTLALESLTGMQHDWNDVDPSIKNFCSGGCHYFLAVGLRLMATQQWEANENGNAVGLIRESRARFDKAYSGGIMHYASKSLTERVDSDRSQTVALQTSYEKDNSLIYFGRVPKDEQTIEAKVAAAETGQWSIPPPSCRVVFQS